MILAVPGSFKSSDGKKTAMRVLGRRPRGGKGDGGRPSPFPPPFSAPVLNRGNARAEVIHKPADYDALNLFPRSAWGTSARTLRVLPDSRPRSGRRRRRASKSIPTRSVGTRTHVFFCLVFIADSTVMTQNPHGSRSPPFLREPSGTDSFDSAYPFASTIPWFVNLELMAFDLIS